MQFINVANNTMFDHLTAKEIGYLAVEGVNMLASSKEWKRIYKRVKKMGLVMYPSVSVADEEVSNCINQINEEFDLWAKTQVDEFIEEMMILGFLERERDEVDEFIEQMMILGFLEEEEDNDD